MAGFTTFPAMAGLDPAIHVFGHRKRSAYARAAQRRSLIAWRRFCAGELQTQGRPERPPPEAVRLRRILEFEVRQRLAPPSKQ
jgi:hypothetical protein